MGGAGERLSEGGFSWLLLMQRLAKFQMALKPEGANWDLVCTRRTVGLSGAKIIKLSCCDREEGRGGGGAA